VHFVLSEGSDGKDILDKYSDAVRAVSQGAVKAHENQRGQSEA